MPERVLKIIEQHTLRPIPTQMDFALLPAKIVALDKATARCRLKQELELPT
jgi:hypothetical protein